VSVREDSSLPNPGNVQLPIPHLNQARPPPYQKNKSSAAVRMSFFGSNHLNTSKIFELFKSSFPAYQVDIIGSFNVFTRRSFLSMNYEYERTNA
jgi:hypothetical protein